MNSIVMMVMAMNMKNGSYKLETYKWNQREQKLIGPEGTFLKKENLRIIG